MKARFLFTLLLALFQIATSNLYATSIRRLSWTEMIDIHHLKAYHLCALSESMTDSILILDVIKSSQKNLKKISINKRYLPAIDRKEFLVFMTFDSADFVFSMVSKDQKEAYEIFSKVNEFDKIKKTTDLNKETRRYKKWLFSLCENQYSQLKIEGFFEWRHGMSYYIWKYAEKYNLFNESDFPTEEARTKVITEKDERRFLKILLNTDYPTFNDWECLFPYASVDKYKCKVKKYIYDFFERYSANFEVNIKKNLTNEIDTGLAFVLLRKVESDEIILRIIAEYDEDDNKYYPMQEKRILESYIYRILEQVKNNATH